MSQTQTQRKPGNDQRQSRPGQNSDRQERREPREEDLDSKNNFGKK